MDNVQRDWGHASVQFDAIKDFVGTKDLSTANEAQTRYDIIDRLIREVLGWVHGTVTVEDYAPTHDKRGYIDYLLRSGDVGIIVEAKKIGASFPTPTTNTRLKLQGSVLGTGEISAAIRQAQDYATNKRAQVTVVTNGECWCIFNSEGVCDDTHATVLFPFSKDGHAEKLFDYLAAENVASGSAAAITNRLPQEEDRLLTSFEMADMRVDRNSIADFLTPALDLALYNEAFINNEDALARCFVSTESRTKFDNTLGMHLADPKPALVMPAKRITRDKKPDHLQRMVQSSAPSYAPPVTLIIGPVGAGKSTYLKHFELVAGKKIIADKQAHWVYVDMEGVGKEGSPRDFIYSALKQYIDSALTSERITYHDTIEKAYAEEIAGMKLGPLAAIASNKDAINAAIANMMQEDYRQLEPYADKVFHYLARRDLVIIVIDNSDLYEDDALETKVFAEGLALSKRIHSNVIVSVRDTTFVRHKNDSAFNAYELRKLWLDPPPLKAVVAARLTYAKKILEGTPADIDLPNNKYLHVPDLGVFFDIVQQSILRGHAGDFIEAMADLDIRRGLSLVHNFLTSGHIEANRALTQYLTGDTKYYFPFHETFKGAILGKWRYFQEQKSECINVFDSRLGSRRLRLMRLHILQFLLQRARSESSLEVPVKEICDFICPIGATPQQVLNVLSFLYSNKLIRTTTSEMLEDDSSVVATRSGGYYAKLLSKTFVYSEECMYDTAIDSHHSWERMRDLTNQILKNTNKHQRMHTRLVRMDYFFQNLNELEQEIVRDVPHLEAVMGIEPIRDAVLAEVRVAIEKTRRLGTMTA